MRVVDAARSERPNFYAPGVTRHEYMLQVAGEMRVVDAAKHSESGRNRMCSLHACVIVDAPNANGAIIGRRQYAAAVPAKRSIAYAAGMPVQNRRGGVKIVRVPQARRFVIPARQ